MYLIKHARIYVGTSLHGTITAMSYDTAFISHGPLKLKNYIMTWLDNGEEHFVEDYLRIGESIKKTLGRESFSNSNFQKHCVIESIGKIKLLM